MCWLIIIFPFNLSFISFCSRSSRCLFHLIFYCSSNNETFQIGLHQTLAFYPPERADLLRCTKTSILPECLIDFKKQPLCVANVFTGSQGRTSAGSLRTSMTQPRRVDLCLFSRNTPLQYLHIQIVASYAGCSWLVRIYKNFVICLLQQLTCCCLSLFFVSLL
jgi:hypothetical protein